MRIEIRWKAGVADVHKALAQRAWLRPVGAMQGMVAHDH
jgi:hypothetical protein